MANLETAQGADEVGAKENKPAKISRSILQRVGGKALVAIVGTLVILLWRGLGSHEATHSSSVTVAVEMAPVDLAPGDITEIAFGFDGDEVGATPGLLVVTVNRGFQDNDPSKPIFEGEGILCTVRYEKGAAAGWTVQTPCAYTVPPGVGAKGGLTFTATFESDDGTKTGSAVYETIVTD